MTPEVNAMTEILAQTENLTTLVGTIFTLITSNAYLAFMAVTGLVFMAISIFGSLKHAAK